MGVAAGSWLPGASEVDSDAACLAGHGFDGDLRAVGRVPTERSCIVDDAASTPDPFQDPHGDDDLQPW